MMKSRRLLELRVIGVSQRIKNSNVEADHDRSVKNVIFAEITQIRFASAGERYSSVIEKFGSLATGCLTVAKYRRYSTEVA
jgi:hypothetical protein